MQPTSRSLAHTLTSPRALIAAAAVVLAVLVGALALGLREGVGDVSTGEAEASFERAGEFALPTFDGDEFVLADHADGPVFLYFWASWCTPCHTEAPAIEALWPEYRDRGVTFVGVNIWDAETDARRFVEQYGLSFPNVRDTGEVYIDYGVENLPVAFFLAPGLEPQRKFVGPLDEPTLRRLLDELVEATG